MDERKALFSERARAVIDGVDGGDHIFIAIALEDEIEQRGREVAYISALLIEIDADSATWDIYEDSDEGGGWIDRAFLFKLIRATPEQRARAFLKAMTNA